MIPFPEVCWNPAILFRISKWHVSAARNCWLVPSSTSQDPASQQNQAFTGWKTFLLWHKLKQKCWEGTKWFMYICTLLKNKVGSTICINTIQQAKPDAYTTHWRRMHINTTSGSCTNEWQRKLRGRIYLCVTGISIAFSKDKVSVVLIENNIASSHVQRKKITIFIYIKLYIIYTQNMQNTHTHTHTCNLRIRPFSTQT